MTIRQRLNFAIRQRLNFAIASRSIILKMILAIIERLKRVNERVYKRVNEFLSDAHERTEIKMLVRKIRLWGYINFYYFDERYNLFVERKRRKLLEDINEIDNKYLEYRLRCESEGLPYKFLPKEERMKEAALKTYHAYLKDDDAYQQKAFLEFLKKKMEDGDDRTEIPAYLEKKYKHASYDEYKGLTSCAGGMLEIEPLDLWIEFFSSDTDYTCLIPEERPDVAYWCMDEDVPRFIFEKPYPRELTEREFYVRFVEEWGVTHYEPTYGDGYNDPVYNYEYAAELDERSQYAYNRYLCAVFNFQRLQKTEERDGDQIITLKMLFEKP